MLEAKTIWRAKRIPKTSLKLAHLKSNKLDQIILEAPAIEVTMPTYVKKSSFAISPPIESPKSL